MNCAWRDRAGSGPWDGEPDELYWLDAVTGYPCIILRTEMGVLCGYVGAPIIKAPISVYEAVVKLDVHGGVTYTGPLPPSGTGADMKVAAFLAECATSVWSMDDYYWFGFDTAHYGDMTPVFARQFPSMSHREDVYRGVDYLRSECTSMASQLFELVNK